MILGIYGFQDAGKTVLVEQLVKTLVAKGYSVSSIKHTPHEKSVDCEGKDTWRHWMAGSDPVVFSSKIETSFIKHSRMPLEDISELIIREFAPDVLIIEGCKEGSFPKIRLGDVPVRKQTMMSDPTLKKLVDYIEAEVSVERTLEKLSGLNCKKCGLDCEGLARAIVHGKKKLGDCKELANVGVSIKVDGKRIETGRFASSVVNDTIRGMLSSLKGYEPGKDVEIRLEAMNEQTRKSRRK